MLSQRDRDADTAICVGGSAGDLPHLGGPAPQDQFGTLTALLAHLANSDNTLRGRQFENVVRYWLHADPVYAPQVARIWRWEQWPGADGPDMGIDLVIETVASTLWAV